MAIPTIPSTIVHFFQHVPTSNHHVSAVKNHAVAVSKKVSPYDGINKALHAAVADIDTNVTGLDSAVADSSFTDVLPSGLQSLKASTDFRSATGLKVEETDSLKYKLDHLNKATVYSFAHKGIVIPIGLTISLLVPEYVMRDLWPVFILLGTHLSIREAKELDELAHQTFGRHTEINQKEAEEIFKKGLFVDLTKTIEIMASLLELMRGLPIESKLEIMGVLGFGLPVTLYALSASLFGMEHGAHYLKTYGEEKLKASDHLGSHTCATKKPYLPIYAGIAFNKTAHFIFSSVGWFAAIGGIYLGGRTIIHAAPSISRLSTPIINTIDQIPVIGDASALLTCCFTAMIVDTCYRRTKPIGATVIKSGYKWTNKIVDKAPVLQAWKKQAIDLVKREVRSDSRLLKMADGVKRRVYTGRLPERAYMFLKNKYA